MSDLLVRLLKAAEGFYRPVFSEDDVAWWPEQDFGCAVAVGLLRPSRPASYVLCRECGETEEVVFLEDSGTKKLHAYTRCPEVGPVEIPMERLRQWVMSYQQLVDLVFGGIGILGHPTVILRDRVWRLGKTNWGGASRNVYFARGLHRSDAWQVMNQGRFSAQSVVFVPVHLPHADSRIEVSPTVIALSDVLHWAAGTVALDLAHVESLLAEQRVTPAVNSSRPIRKRATRTATIELLTKHMMDHVKAARDHALAKCEFGREAKLLPRPTKRQLGRLIGASEVTVGRCFNDPAARELQFLWELAGDLSRLLEYGCAATG